jgi:Uma2 family endonuclease
MRGDMATDYQVRPISARDYHKMGGAGIIGPDERVELLDGELIAMPPIGPDHAFCVRELTKLFFRRFADCAIIDIQNPVALDAYSEPEPDVMLLAPKSDGYRSALPEPNEVLLIVEVANTSWRYDRGRKLRAYARAGIAELWIVHLATSRVIRFREPDGETYRDERVFERGESIAPQAFPSEAFEVAALLP